MLYFSISAILGIQYFPCACRTGVFNNALF